MLSKLSGGDAKAVGRKIEKEVTGHVLTVTINHLWRVESRSSSWPECRFYIKNALLFFFRFVNCDVFIHSINPLVTGCLFDWRVWHHFFSLKAIVLAPTRELARQSNTVISCLSLYMDIKVFACTGGERVGQMGRALRDGVHVVVGMCELFQKMEHFLYRLFSFFWQVQCLYILYRGFNLVKGQSLMSTSPLAPSTRDHGWFFKPQLFPIKIILLKRGTLQLSNAKKISSIRQGTAKLQEFKVEWFWGSFATVTMGKSRFDGTERLAFRPLQRFTCIHSDVGAGDRRRPICFFSPLGSSCTLCTGLVSFVRTQDEGAMCPKITIGMMLPEILKWANSVGPGDVQLLWSTSGSWCLVRLVEGRSSNSLAQSWQSKHMFRSPTACCLVLKLWCEAFMHTVSAQKLVADKKKKRHASQSKPGPISSYSLHGRDRWDIDSLPQTRWRPEAPQPISLKLGTQTNRYL